MFKSKKEKKKQKDIVTIKLDERDIEICLLELKRRVGSPKLPFRK